MTALGGGVGGGSRLDFVLQLLNFDFAVLHAVTDQSRFPGGIFLTNSHQAGIAIFKAIQGAGVISLFLEIFRIMHPHINLKILVLQSDFRMGGNGMDYENPNTNPHQINTSAHYRKFNLFSCKKSMISSITSNLYSR